MPPYSARHHRDPSRCSRLPFEEWLHEEKDRKPLIESSPRETWQLLDRSVLRLWDTRLRTPPDTRRNHDVWWISQGGRHGDSDFPGQFLRRERRIQRQ